MRPGSDFLRGLAADPGGLQGVRFTSIWSPLDLTIIPTSSSVIAEARSIRVCVPIHQMMPWDRRVFHLVEQELATSLD
jgi:triacylglycerol lipase